MIFLRFRYRWIDEFTRNRSERRNYYCSGLPMLEGEILVLLDNLVCPHETCENPRNRYASIYSGEHRIGGYIWVEDSTLFQPSVCSQWRYSDPDLLIRHRWLSLDGVKPIGFCPTIFGNLDGYFIHSSLTSRRLKTHRTRGERYDKYDFPLVPLSER